MVDWGMNAANRHHLAAVDHGSLIGLRITKLGLAGDFDGDGDVDADDIDLIYEFIRTSVPPTGASYDLVADGMIDQFDVDLLVHSLVEAGDGTGTEYGDFNLDGLVNGTDLSILSSNFGGPAGYAGGNANGDLLINGTDLSILSSSFGFVAAAAIPEPMTLSLLAAGAVALLRRRS